MVTVSMTSFPFPAKFYLILDCLEDKFQGFSTLFEPFIPDFDSLLLQ